jgi:hypothetical protein
MAGVEDAFHARWAPAKDGFYFVQRTGLNRSLKFLNFDTGRMAEVMPLDKPWGVCALAVSPDGRSVLYSQLDYAAHDLWSIENFR